jgi:hypothetical protein
MLAFTGCAADDHHLVIGRHLVCMVRRDRPDHGPVLRAAVPVAYWAPFFLAPLVPGTAVDDTPHLIPRVAGAPTSLLGAAAAIATAAGWLLDRRCPGLRGMIRLE